MQKAENMAHDAWADVDRRCSPFVLLAVEIGALLCINLHEYLENDDPAGLWAADRPYVARAHFAVRSSRGPVHDTVQG